MEGNMAQKYCTSCGEALAADVRFCGKCGAPVNAETKAKSGTRKKPAPPANKTRDIVIVIGVLVVFGLGYLIFAPHAEPPQPGAQQMQQGQGGGPMGSQLQDLPTDYQGLVQVGNRTMDASNWAVAAEAYRRALEIEASDPNVRTDYGICLFRMGLPDRALAEFRKVTSKYAQHSLSRFNMGVVFYSEGVTDSAKVYFNKYLEMEPTGPASDAARDLLTQLNG